MTHNISQNFIIQAKNCFPETEIVSTEAAIQEAPHVDLSVMCLIIIAASALIAIAIAAFLHFFKKSK